MVHILQKVCTSNWFFSSAFTVHYVKLSHWLIMCFHFSGGLNEWAETLFFFLVPYIVGPCCPLRRLKVKDLWLSLIMLSMYWEASKHWCGSKWSTQKLRIRAYSTYICVSLGDGVKKTHWLWLVSLVTRTLKARTLSQIRHGFETVNPSSLRFF